MNASLIITPSVAAPIVTVADEARKLRDSLLVDAGTVTTVTDRLDADSATSILRQLTDFEKVIESQREEVKAPVLKVGREIDSLAKDLLANVRVQQSRISRLVGSFEAEERRKADDARRAAENEAARIAYEANKAQREAIKAAPTPEAGLRTADAIAGKAQTAIAEVKAAVVVPPKAAAAQLRTDVCFEVTDMKAFYTAKPELVNLEPNGTAIRAILRSNPNIQIPGLKHWTEAKLNTR